MNTLLGWQPVFCNKIEDPAFRRLSFAARGALVTLRLMADRFHYEVKLPGRILDKEGREWVVSDAESWLANEFQRMESGCTHAAAWRRAGEILAELKRGGFVEWYDDESPFVVTDFVLDRNRMRTMPSSFDAAPREHGPDAARRDGGPSDAARDYDAPPDPNAGFAPARRSSPLDGSAFGDDVGRFNGGFGGQTVQTSEFQSQNSEIQTPKPKDQTKPRADEATHTHATTSGQNLTADFGAVALDGDERRAGANEYRDAIFNTPLAEIPFLAERIFHRGGERSRNALTKKIRDNAGPHIERIVRDSLECVADKLREKQNVRDPWAILIWQINDRLRANQAFAALKRPVGFEQ